MTWLIPGRRRSAQLRQKYATREMGSLGSGKIFEEILSTMRPHLTSAKPAKESPKFVLLSAHDGTLLALLTALNVPDFRTSSFPAFRVGGTPGC
jgi:hypothetical protein